MFKPLPKSRLADLRKDPSWDIPFYKELGRTPDIHEYTDQEITEMYKGAVRHSGMLLTGGDYLIRLEDVKRAVCVIQSVKFHEKPTVKEAGMPWLFQAGNIRSYYIHNYFLYTKKPVSHFNRHSIGSFLAKYGVLGRAKGMTSHLYWLRNDNPSLEIFKAGPAPAALYEPINLAINRFFFNQDRFIDDFSVEIDDDIYAARY